MRCAPSPSFEPSRMTTISRINATSWQRFSRVHTSLGVPHPEWRAPGGSGLSLSVSRRYISMTTTVFNRIECIYHSSTITHCPSESSVFASACAHAHAARSPTHARTPARRPASHHAAPRAARPHHTTVLKSGMRTAAYHHYHHHHTTDTLDTGHHW